MNSTFDSCPLYGPAMDQPVPTRMYFPGAMDSPNEFGDRNLMSYHHQSHFTTAQLPVAPAPIPPASISVPGGLYEAGMAGPAYSVASQSLLQSGPFFTSGSRSLAAQAQVRAVTRLSSINVTIRRSSSTSSSVSQVDAPNSSARSTSPLLGTFPSRSPTPLPPCKAPNATIDREKALREDRADAQRELEDYEREIVAAGSGERVLGIVRYWERKEHVFPLLFRVAMDVLPAQASAVPCERVFSSSKETCMLRRSRISPQLMEALQILKFTYKRDRLNFTAGLIMTRQELEDETSE